MSGDAYRGFVARYAAAQIYAFARSAGFSPDEAVTMTAIALAESRGRSSAHNTMGEDSIGLWQINARAHPGLASELDLYDPRDNAIAAFRVSGGGRDVSPWTTTHGGSRAPYTRFREEAQAAAIAHGDVAGLGMWQGTSGYGDPRAAGSEEGAPRGETTKGPPEDVPPPDPATTPRGYDVSGQPAASGASHFAPHALALEPESIDPLRVPSPAPVNARDLHGLPLAPDSIVYPGMGVFPVPSSRDEPTSRGLPGGRSATEAFVDAALSQRGDRYVFGATAEPDDANPTAFDCSELVKWAAHQAGVEITDGAAGQYLELKHKGLLIPVEQAINTRGALLFSFAREPTPGAGEPSHAHVAISLGDNRTIEARGSAYGVDSFAASKRRFQYAALIPGANTGEGSARSSEDGAADGASGPPPGLGVSATRRAGGRLLDTDGDGLGDRLEQRLGLDPHQQDIVEDRLRDSYTLLFGNTDPFVTDSGAAQAWRAQDDSMLLAAVMDAAPAGRTAGDHQGPALDPSTAGAAHHGHGLPLEPEQFTGYAAPGHIVADADFNGTIHQSSADPYDPWAQTGAGDDDQL